MKGNLLVLTAPSGTGKTTIVKRLLEDVPRLLFSVSHATRKPRPYEVDGKDYFFVDDPTFARLVEEEAFLEWAMVHGHHYGTSRRFVDEQIAAGCDVLLDIDVQGAAQVLARRMDAVSIFLLPPSLSELRRRLEGRGTESVEEIGRRLRRARREVQHYHEFGYVLVNQDAEVAAREIRSIIEAERCRLACRREAIDAILSTFVENQGGQTSD